MPEAAVLAQPGARDYEAIYILRPDIEPDAATKISNRVSEVLAREEGKLVKVESWGRRKLAYPVRKYRRGIYVYLRFYGKTSLVAELERNLRMQRDGVLKFMTIKIADEVAEEIEVSPDDIAFAAVEPLTEEEMDESREKILGLVDPHDHRSPRGDDRGRPHAPAAADATEKAEKPALAPESAQAAPESKAEATPEATAEVKSEATPEAKSEPTPEAKSEATPEQQGEEK